MGQANAELWLVVTRQVQYSEVLYVWLKQTNNNVSVLVRLAGVKQAAGACVWCMRWSLCVCACGRIRIQHRRSGTAAGCWSGGSSYLRFDTEALGEKRRSERGGGRR